MSLCVCVCELIERAAMSVRRPSSCLSLLPPSLSFLPSPPSPCLSLSHFPSFNWSTFFSCLPLFFVSFLSGVAGWTGWWNLFTGSRSTACLSLSMHFTLSSLSSWLCQAFCSSAQQQSPEQGGAFHFLRRQRGSWLVTPTEKWMHFSLRHTLLPRFPLLHSPAPLSIALTVFLCLSLFLSQLPYYNILYLRATQHRSAPPTHTHTKSGIFSQFL